MSNSEIFNNFVKIAEEQGLTSSDDTKKKLEKTRRADSLSIEDIEKLYNVKPDQPKGAKYKRNITENAHPESVIVAPSYDKLNALVENDNERQNIILNIVNKTPNGHLTQHKYAENKLILNLVRVANDLDNRDQDKLMSLADTCLFQLNNKQMVKEALGPLAIVGIAVPVLLGALYLQQHMAFVNEGFEVNHQKLVAELDDILQDSASWGTGYDYRSDFKEMISSFKTKISSFYDLYQNIEPIIKDLEKPRTAQELVQLASNPKTTTVMDAYRKFRAAADNMLPYISTIETNFASESFKTRQIQDKGWMSSLVDKMQVFHGGKGLVADDFDDVVRAISPYKKSIADILQILKKAESLEMSAKRQIEQASQASKQQFDSEESSPVSSDKGKTDMDSKISDLEKDLSGGII
jgi:hypothetical protein